MSFMEKTLKNSGEDIDDIQRFDDESLESPVKRLTFRLHQELISVNRPVITMNELVVAKEGGSDSFSVKLNCFPLIYRFPSQVHASASFVRRLVLEWNASRKKPEGYRDHREN